MRALRPSAPLRSRTSSLTGHCTETYEWFDITNADPDDCRVTQDRVDMRLLAQPPTVARNPAPRALAPGGGAAKAAAAKSHRRSGSLR